VTPHLYLSFRENERYSQKGSLNCHSHRGHTNRSQEEQRVSNLLFFLIFCATCTYSFNELTEIEISPLLTNALCSNFNSVLPINHFKKLSPPLHLFWKSKKDSIGEKDLHYFPVNLPSNFLGIVWTGCAVFLNLG
jgi:hypothetical protein